MFTQEITKGSEREVKYNKYLTWHCHQCGAPTNPNDKKCDYCGRPTKNKARLFDRETRVFAKAGDRKIYLYEVNQIETIVNNVDTIDCTMLEDSVTRYITRRNDWDKVSMYAFYTKNALEKSEFIKDIGKKKIDLFIETDNYSYGIECNSMHIGIPVIPSSNSLMSIPLTFSVKTYMGILENTNHLNDGCNCPNCGAELRKRFGLCDYCGGWSEYADCYY